MAHRAMISVTNETVLTQFLSVCQYKLLHILVGRPLNCIYHIKLWVMLMSRKMLPHLVAAFLDCECSLLMLVKWMQVLLCGHT